MTMRVLHAMTSSPTAVVASWIMLILSASRCTCVPVPPAAAPPGAAAQCSPQNINPCVTFPNLCSAGGGSCIPKDPCEYQCQCPDGRLGRDCSTSSHPDPGSVVDTLLIFPKDIFADLNQASTSQMVPNSDRQTTTSPATQKLETTAGVSMSTTETWTTKTTIPSLETTRASPSELPTHKLAPLSSTTSSTTVTTAATLGVDSSVKSILTTPVPSHAETIAGSPVSKSSTESTIYPASGKNAAAQAWNLGTFTGNPTYAPSITQQSTLATPKGLDRPSSNVSFLLNLSSTPGGSTQRMQTNIGSPTEPQPVIAGNSSKASTEPKAGSAQAVDSPRPEISKSGPSEIIHTSIKHNVILSQGSPLPSSSTAAVQHQQGTTQQHHTTTTTPTTNPPLSSTQDGGRSSQQTTSTPASSTGQSTAASEEFPTIFKLTLDNPLNPIDSGKNSALSMVVHRVFVPIEKFQPARKSAP